MTDESWRALARCSGLTASFFPEPHTRDVERTVEEAKALCRRCPVSAPCLDFALEHGMNGGVWGGLTEKERAKLRRAAARAAVGGKG